MLSFSIWPFALLALPGSAVMQVADLFLVDLTTNQNGGCMGREASLQQSLADSSAMVKVALTAVTAYTSDGRARRLLDAWFNFPSQAQRDDIYSRGDSTFLRDRYQQVDQFLDSGTTSFNGKGHLFCDSTWLVRGDLDDQALDINGQPVVKLNGDPALVRDEYAQQIAALSSEGRSIYPYHSSLLNQYVLDGSYGSRSSGYCSKSTNLAATQEQTNPKSITLCSRSFKGNTLSQVVPSPIPRAQLNTPGANPQNIVAVRCVALTLLHELFHYVLGNDATPDHRYAVSEMLVLDNGRAVVNTETFTLVAEAAYLTVHTGNVGPTEFWSGYCTTD